MVEPKYKKTLVHLTVLAVIQKLDPVPTRLLRYFTDRSIPTLFCAPEEPFFSEEWHKFQSMDRTRRFRIDTAKLPVTIVHTELLPDLLDRTHFVSVDSELYSGKLFYM